MGSSNWAPTVAKKRDYNPPPKHQTSAPTSFRVASSPLNLFDDDALPSSELRLDSGLSSPSDGAG